MWFGFQLAAGATLFFGLLYLVAWLFALLIDVFDGWSSRFTPAQAAARSALVARNRWPPAPSSLWSRGEVIALVMGLSLIALTTAACRYWLRLP